MHPSLQGALAEGGLKKVAEQRISGVRSAILQEMSHEFEAQREPIRYGYLHV